MRVLALFVFIMAGFVLLGNQKAYAETETSNKKPTQKHVIVESGDTLTKLAKEYKTTYPRLFFANPKIENPDIIHPGDKLRIPNPDEKLKKRPLTTSTVAPPAVSTVQPVNPTQSYQPVSYSSSPVVAQNVDGSVWDQLAACESGGNWSINTGNGYYGGLQFNPGTWASNGGQGLPHQASKAEQIRVAENLRAARGFSPWPACSAKLGLS